MEHLELFVSLAGTIVGLLVAVATIVVKFAKNVKTKKIFTCLKKKLFNSNV